MRTFRIVVLIVSLSISTGLVWGGEDDITLTVSRHNPDIIPILRECLEYIQDGSVDQGAVFDTLVYRPVTRDGVAQDEAERSAYKADRYRRETELHKKIKAMIEKLEQE